MGFPVMHRLGRLRSETIFIIQPQSNAFAASRAACAQCMPLRWSFCPLAGRSSRAAVSGDGKPLPGAAAMKAGCERPVASFPFLNRTMYGMEKQTNPFRREKVAFCRGLCYP